MDLTAAVETIARAEPQAIVMVALYKQASEFMTRMRHTGLRPRYMAVSTVGTDQMIAQMGEGARGIGVSQVMPYPWNDTATVVHEYQRLIAQGDASVDFSYSGIEGYVTIKLVIEALRKAGPELSRERFVDTLEGLRQFDLGGFRVSYSPTDHGGSTFVDLMVIGEGGRVRR